MVDGVAMTMLIIVKKKITGLPGQNIIEINGNRPVINWHGGRERELPVLINAAGSPTVQSFFRHVSKMAIFSRSFDFETLKIF